MKKTTINVSEANFDLLTQEQKKQLALMQHNGEDYFIVDGKAYEGNEEEKREQFKEYQEEGGIFDFAGWCEEDETEISDYDENGNYLVLTDEEADENWEESLSNYIEECIEPVFDKAMEELGSISNYYKFDREMWIRDAKMDGRGHSLSSYDGHEHEEKVGDETFYIYRIN
jgi:hypothetical protein